MGVMKNIFIDIFDAICAARHEIKKYPEEYVSFVSKCREDVVKEISRHFEDEITPNTSEIIRDYKCEMYEDDLMSEEDFDKIYELLEVISLEAAMAVC